MRYVKFNDQGKSIEITNTLPEDATGYYPVPAAITGPLLKLSGGVVVEITAEEMAADIEAARILGLANSVKQRRNKLLDEADKLTQADRWAGYTDAQKASIAAYKQALRDLPEQEGFPLTVVFPELN